MVGIEWRDKVVGIEWRGGEWTGGYEGENTFERGTFRFWGIGRILERGGDCIGAFFQGRDWKTVFSGFRLEEFVGLLQGSIGCWEFWARGPGILTESWS